MSGWAKLVLVGFGLLALHGADRAWTQHREREDRSLRQSTCNYNDLPVERCYPP
jgi:hypothetical protein